MPDYDHKTTQTQAAGLQDAILAILKDRVGAASAIKARDIAAHLGLAGRYADRPVREAIKTLRRSGHLIISSVSRPYGYFLAADEKEWHAFRNSNLRPRALDILETTSAMNRAAQARWGGVGGQDLVIQPGLELVA